MGGGHRDAGGGWGAACGGQGSGWTVASASVLPCTFPGKQINLLHMAPARRHREDSVLSVQGISDPPSWSPIARFTMTLLPPLPRPANTHPLPSPPPTHNIPFTLALAPSLSLSLSHCPLSLSLALTHSLSLALSSSRSLCFLVWLGVSVSRYLSVSFWQSGQITTTTSANLVFNVLD